MEKIMKLKFLIRSIPRIDPSLPLDGYKLCLYIGTEEYIINLFPRQALAYVRTDSRFLNQKDYLDDWIIYKLKKL